MSASLVGSEMCIRDRYEVTPWPSICRDERVVAIVYDRCMCGLRVTSGPVSYTHLTLPTICSV
eukprot:9823703-Alexandrium_andersonii.AAC.1